MEISIYNKLIGQIIRYVLTIGAAYLVFVGVDKETYGEAVNVAVNILTPLVIIGFVQLWSFLQKRTAEYKAEYARRAPPNTTMAEVEAMVARREPPSVPT